MNPRLRIVLMCVVLIVWWLGARSEAKVLRVGPGHKYAMPCQAIRNGATGDIIEIDSYRSYKGDVCTWKTNRMTIRGVGTARARIDAGGQNAAGKGIWVIAGDDTTIENIEFSGATAPEGNGAAIRQEGSNLTIRNCYFHDNQEGVLAGDNPNSAILVEFSEFSQNGTGDGQTHNLYVNHVAKLILRFSYSHHAKVGHLVKTRAAVNFVLYNRLSDEIGGTASLELDIPNGGTSYVIGNIIEQGSQTQNSSILGYRTEGSDDRNPGMQLYVINNTFVNNRSQGGTFLQVRADTLTPALVVNNIFSGRGTLSTQKSTVFISNLVTDDPGFVDAAQYDYRLRQDSPARGIGIQPQADSSFPLLPDQEYVHPACGRNRTIEGKLDLGAIAFGRGTTLQRLGPARCLEQNTSDD